MKGLTRKMTTLASVMAIVVGGCGLDSKNILIPIAFILGGFVLGAGAACMYVLGW